MIDIIAIEDSIIKVLLLTKNPKDNINIILQDSNGVVIAYSVPEFDYKMISLKLMANKKAYRLKIIYDSVDSSETSPIYNLRIALMPVK